MKITSSNYASLSILLLFVIVLSAAFASPPAHAEGIPENAHFRQLNVIVNSSEYYWWGWFCTGPSDVPVGQGQIFIIRHELQWYEPAPGYFTLEIYWDCPDNRPWENFTFVGASAYFDNGDPIEVFTMFYEGPSPENENIWRYTIVVNNAVADPRNGIFYVDISMRVSGNRGTPHVAMDHPIYHGGIIIVESLPWTDVSEIPPITISVLPWPPTPAVIPTTVDIDPDTLNLKSKGKWITCYIELPLGYSVENIDVGTVMLLVDNDNVPAEARPTDVGDHDNDGIADLMVKFSRPAVQALASIGEFEATVVGEVAGIPFEGSDVIRVIDFGIDTLYKARLGMDLNLDNGIGLALRFYTYSGALQGENVIWNGVAPAHVVFIENVPHPEGRPIESVALALTDEGNVIPPTIASFTVTKNDLFRRIMTIKGKWPIASDDERNALFKEIIDIKGQWPFAPL